MVTLIFAFLWIKITVYDVTGIVVKQLHRITEKGYNTLVMRKDELGAST